MSQPDLRSFLSDDLLNIKPIEKKPTQDSNTPSLVDAYDENKNSNTNSISGLNIQNTIQGQMYDEYPKTPQNLGFEGFGQTAAEKIYLKELLDGNGKFFDIDKVIGQAIEFNASDVRITPYQKVSFKRYGEVRYVDDFGNIPATTINALYEMIVKDTLKPSYNKNYSLDTEYTVRTGEHAGRRCRLSVARTMNDKFMVFRVLSNIIPTPQELGIGDEMMSWLDNASGLILINGSTGTGKTTTLSSMLEYVNLNKRKVINTVERPIENLLSHVEHSSVTQRSVGSGLDTPSFAQGLTDALRQSPDLILVGEVRNREEMTTLIDASDSGHLSLSTMHTNSASKTLSRIQTIFNTDAPGILDSLANNAIGFANQVLVKKEGVEGVIAVREILPFEYSEDVPELVRLGNVKGLYDYQMDNGITMEHELVRLIQENKIDKDDAQVRADNRRAFRQLLQKGVDERKPWVEMR